MGYPRYTAYWAPLNPKQRYHFTGKDSDWQQGFNEAINILLADIDFHELLQQHFFTAIIDPDWSVRINYTGDPTRYYLHRSESNLEIWNCYSQVFQDYGLQLRDDWQDRIVKPCNQSPARSKSTETGQGIPPFNPDKYLVKN